MDSQLAYTIVMKMPTKEQLVSYWNVYKDYRNFALIGLALLVLLFAGSGLVAQAAVILTRAAPATTVSSSDSYIIGTALLATADGKEQVKVAVFLRDNEGHPVSGKNVTVFGLSSMEGTSAITDEQGKAVFAGNSSVAGQFSITARAEAGELPGKVVVTFK